ncbi:MAG: DNA-directed RNA polymerase subunit beta [Chloroflexi bacterium]|nr:MAG: DNA-directed RNA polymerase subunit beta [Anaerolineaceae bacterium 4572_32.1]RLD00376.1 MAG: DNA-directed RNA polymerase subunit beta [Chloroflexota bacterium]
MGMTYLGNKSYARTVGAERLPRLIEVQLKSFRWLQEEGLTQLFDEISPIESFNGNLNLYFPGSQAREAHFDLDYHFGDPKYSVEECLERDITYSVPLYVQVVLDNRETGEIVESEIFLGDFPLMTGDGTFIINGTERVVVSQLIRSPGVYFDVEEDRKTGRRLCTAKMIPDRGAWLEFETRKSDYINVKFNRKRKIPVTILLRALAAIDDHTGSNPLGGGTNEELLALFQDADSNPHHQYIPTTFRQEPDWHPKKGRTLAEEALVEFYRRMRPGDPATLDNAREYMEQQLFDPRRYDLQRVGRYKLNQRLGLDMDLEHRTITKQDLIVVIGRIIRINNGSVDADDIDHLGNRRIKTVGELIQNKVRVGLRRMERVVVERMSIRESESLTPVNLINIRPVVASIRQFFGSSQLSQFMEQTNPLAELTHKRTLSALGPGGLRRERAGFDVRDVHYSHYGRICPIETPEGPNIGLIGRLATYARVNSLGFIETPYRRVIRAVEPTVEALTGQLLRENVVDPESGAVVAEAGVKVTPELAGQIAALEITEEIPVVPVVSHEKVVYLSADKEEHYTIAQANAKLDEEGHFVQSRVSARRAERFLFTAPEKIDYIDIAPCQIVGVSAALIPFLEHDDANRALMGSNMQRQTVTLINPQAPLVATGMEWRAALDSGQVVMSEKDGEVVSVTGDKVIVHYADGLHTYPLRKYQRSNQSTCIDQRPVVYKGQRVRKDQVLADSSSTEGGGLALGQNVVCAFMSWEGGNFEDAILLSERMVGEDRFTSIHIEKHEVEARDTKLGPEEITRDIPNVGDEALKDLDEDGIVRVGAEVGPLDILVGKITPKGEKELSPEEKLLRAIFGEKAREVKDSSLRLPHGERGKVVDVKIFDREEYRDLKVGVEKMVRVSVAQMRKVTEGDKMAGRHGNKGIVSKIVPVEDMPFLPDGTPIDVILNPLGVPGRMNIGQILETHLGWAAHRLGFRAVTPVFDGADELQVEAELARAWLIDRAWDEITERAWAWLKAQSYSLDMLWDDEEARQMYIVAWLAERGYDTERLITEHTYARRSVLYEWLRERGYDKPEEILSFEDDTRTLAERVAVDQRAGIACLRIWLEDRGQKVTDLDDKAVESLAVQVSVETSDPLPTLGKMVLYNGKTGEPFDQPVTVGVIYMMKLHHLVEDKVHARSTGPYSLVTQQPLGGKAQFGGQRFGEMEVWALEAYGAAHVLQEMLTIKSDDVQGRVKAYEAIVKGEPVQEPGVPASFKVLVKELQSLGLAVEAITQDGEVLHFGKGEEQLKPPRLGMGLLGFDR